MKKEIKGQTVMKGAMILATAVFVSRLIGLIYKIPITNILGDEGMAIYSSAYSVYALLLTFSAIGIPSAISKLVSERIAAGSYRDAHRVFKVALAYSTLIGIGTSILLWFGAEQVSVLLKGDTTLAMPLRALAPTLIIVSVIAIIRGYFQGLGNMIPSATSQVIEQLFNAVFSVTLAYVLIPKGIIASATGSTLGPGIGAMASLAFLGIIYMVGYSKLHQYTKNEVVPKDKKRESSKTILKQVILLVVPILLTSSIFSITTTIDQKMLYEMLPQSVTYLEEKGELHRLPISNVEEQVANGADAKNLSDKLVGQYMSKYVTLTNLPVSLIVQLATAAMPAIAAAMMLKNYDDLRRKVYMVLKMGIMLAVPAGVGLAVFGTVIVPILFSGAPDGGELVMYGAIGIIPMGLAQLTGGMLQGMGKQRVPVRNALIACGLKILLNGILLMIPYCHIYGVIYSSIICYCFYAYLNVKELNKVIQLKISWRSMLGKPLGAATIMGVVSYGLFFCLNSWKPLPVVWVALAMTAAVGIYGISLVAIGGVTKEEVGSLPGGSILGRWMK